MVTRKKKQQVKINNVSSLEGLLQETYTDACLQITDTQSAINELKTSTKAEDVDDITKVMKERSGLLKVKDSAIRIKLEIAKLQSSVIQSKGDVTAAIEERSDGKITDNDFKAIREMLVKSSDINE